MFNDVIKALLYSVGFPGVLIALYLFMYVQVFTQIDVKKSKLISGLDEFINVAIIIQTFINPDLSKKKVGNT